MDNDTGLPIKHINYGLHGKVMLCTGVLLFVALLLILCFHNYARILFNNRRRRYIRHRAQRFLSISTATRTNPTSVASKGLDPSVIKTIPTVIYSTVDKDCHFSTSLACAVCLSEFENDEKARVLPNCNHAFHVDCIDVWFYSHSNCPLCRAPVQADIQVNPPKTLEHTVVPVAETASSEPPRQDIEINNSSATATASPSSSSSSSSPSSLKMESCPMKTREIVGVGL